MTKYNVEVGCGFMILAFALFGAVVGVQKCQNRKPLSARVEDGDQIKFWCIADDQGGVYKYRVWDNVEALRMYETRWHREMYTLQDTYSEVLELEKKKGRVREIPGGTWVTFRRKDAEPIWDGYRNQFLFQIEYQGRLWWAFGGNFESKIR